RLARDRTRRARRKCRSLRQSRRDRTRLRLRSPPGIWGPVENPLEHDEERLGDLRTDLALLVLRVVDEENERAVLGLRAVEGDRPGAEAPSSARRRLGSSLLVLLLASARLGAFAKEPLHHAPMRAAQATEEMPRFLPRRRELGEVLLRGPSAARELPDRAARA